SGSPPWRRTAGGHDRPLWRVLRAMLPRPLRERLSRHSRSRSCCKLPRAFAPDFSSIMSKPKPAPLPSGTVVGGYQVIKKLAAGGFGVVYLCEDGERKLVALKEYLPSSLAERSPGELTPRVKPEKQPLYRLGLKSFFEEGRSLAQISHTSVVSVLNFFRENETVYMVMNYLQGDTLQDFIVTARDLKRDKVFRESTIRSLFDEIL